MAQMRQSDKGRNFATICYLENNSIEHIREVFNENHIRGYVSPLHDKDLRADGEAKKPHWHVCFTFKGQKSYNKISELVEAFGGVGIEMLDDFEAYALYLIHYNEKNKFHYNAEDVESFGGLQYSSLLKVSTDKEDELPLITKLCEFARICDDFDQLVEFALYDCGNSNAIKLLMSRAYFFDKLIKKPLTNK